MSLLMFCIVQSTERAVHKNTAVCWIFGCTGNLTKWIMIFVLCTIDVRFKMQMYLKKSIFNSVDKSIYIFFFASLAWNSYYFTGNIFNQGQCCCCSRFHSGHFCIILSKKIILFCILKLGLFEFLGPHFLCWILGVVPFNTWLISS